MKRNLFEKLEEELNPNYEPKPDIAICSECGWRGSVEKCIKEQDGDWESGYYEIDECPICKDGGCIDNYDMSPQRFKEWKQWNKSHNNIMHQTKLPTAVKCKGGL